MRQLTEEEKEAIREEVENFGSPDIAIEFCLGYDLLTRMTVEAARTVKAVKEQLFNGKCLKS